MDKAADQPSERSKAAEVIQRAWRRHIDIQVYRYYRDLITFKCQGDPSMMLRCINPVEAQYLDAASGAFVRFRLAGEKFPPNIYYKVFTKSPVVDMCANSPKNYVKQSSLKLAAREHNNTVPVPNNSDSRNSDAHSDWYKRFENNGWRIIADRVIHNADSDKTTFETSRKLYKVHHDNLVKIEDLRRRKKEKKIKWLKKLYDQKMLKTRTEEDSEKIMAVAEDMITAVDSDHKKSSHKFGVDRYEDWEVNELLGWTNALNFEDYLDDWKNIASTSSAIEELNPNQSPVFQSEPLELTVHRESRLQDVQPAPLSHQFLASARTLTYTVPN